MCIPRAASRTVHAVMQHTIGYRLPGTVYCPVLDDNGSNMEFNLASHLQRNPRTHYTHSVQASRQALAVQPLSRGLVAVLSTLICSYNMLNVRCSPVDLRSRAVCNWPPKAISKVNV
jgi:hypothetical protein